MTVVHDAVTLPFDLAGDALGSFVGSATAPVTDAVFKMGLLLLAAIVVVGVVL